MRPTSQSDETMAPPRPDAPGDGGAVGVPPGEGATLAAGQETWPPAAFDFETPRLRGASLAFERDASGEVRLVRDCTGFRLVVPLEAVPLALDVPEGGRDARLLRLVSPALRYVERVRAGDPVPAELRGCGPEPDEAQSDAACAALADALGEHAGAEGRALRESLRRLPPGRDLFERAAAQRALVDGHQAAAALLPLARDLGRAARAHARVLAAAAAQPDYAAMERAVRETREVLAADRLWASDLLSLALAARARRVSLPRRTVFALLSHAGTTLRRPEGLTDLPGLARAQDDACDRLLEIGTFWARTASAWAEVDPVNSDRREVEALTRETAHRLTLVNLYRPPGRRAARSAAPLGRG